MLRRKVLSLATALVFLITSGLAVAQDATTPPPAAPPAAEPTPPVAPPAAEPTPPAAVPAPAEVVVGEQPAAATPTSADEKTEEIVVTGSRIRRKDLTTPAPVTIVNAEAIANSGKISLGDFLQTLPEQGNSVNTQVNNGNDGSVRVSLRSLSPVRTLVLVNGRRIVAGGTQDPTAAPDLNTIPAAAIERIEILKDGASAVYGSDAIAGVVNVILKKRYSGSEVAAYGGVSAEGDGQTYDLSAVTGTGSDRGNILFSIGYQEQRKVLAGDRKWAETTYWYWDPFTDEVRDPPIANGNSGTAPDGRFSLPGLTRDPDTAEILACSSAATRTPLYDALCADALGGTNASFVPTFDGIDSTYNLYDGSLFNTNPTNYLLTPNRRLQIFATGDTNLGDVARAFFEASYVNRTSSQTLAPMPVVNNTIPNKPVRISAGSIYNPLGVDITSWRRRTVEFGDRRWSQDLDTFRAVLGVDGSVGDWAGPLQGWSWEASYNYGRTGGSQTNGGLVRMPNLANATGPSLDPDGSVVGPDGLAGTSDDPTSPVANGDEVCVRSAAGGLVAANIIPGCVPANMLGGVGTLSPAARDYLTFTGTDKSYIQQQVYAFNTAGEILSLPTSERPIGLALGVEHRKEAAGFQPDVITASLESAGNNQLATDGGYDVTEGYAELSIPLVSNMVGVQDLELSAAIRAFDYSTFGSDATYKLGARWSPIRDVTLRGTYSTAFRAPNVGELFGGTQDSFDFTSGDPCAEPPEGGTLPARCTEAGQPWGGVAASGSADPQTQFLSKRTPNPGLEPETADIITAGLVFEPQFFRNFTATLDFYTIGLDDQIAIRGSQFILNGCYERGDPEMCALITRNPETSQIEQIIDTRDNIGKIDTQGLDFAFRYGVPTRVVGRFNFVVDGTYLIKYDTTDDAGFVTEGDNRYDDQLALPKWKVNTSVLWGMGGLGAGLSARWTQGYNECLSGSCSVDDSNQRRVESAFPVDVFLAYQFKTAAGSTGVTVGMNNVFDETPPYLYNAGSANSDPATYDYLGRYVYARLVQSF